MCSLSRWQFYYKIAVGEDRPVLFRPFCCNYLIMWPDIYNLFDRKGFLTASWCEVVKLLFDFRYSHGAKKLEFMV